ncbi:MAG: glycosyltransferase family 2 protein, partial [Myxococcota bacterium]|nr:glycosyltransferase family 2 protein [Myxococcota bacterium]
MSVEFRQGWVSVVIPTYNRAERLAASVDSCLEQTHDSVEVIVVDDGSTDETPEALAELERRWGSEHLRWVRQDNQGACAARNTGMALATGEYLQLHDSDDLLMPDKFTEQVAALERTGADCAVSDILLVKDDAEHTPIREIRYGHDLREATAHYRHASIPTLLMRRSTFPAHLHWNTRLERFQDIDFVVRYFLSIEETVHTPGLHVLYVHHEGPQISDTYTQGHQDLEMFEELRTYWEEAQHLIPSRNHGLVRRAAMTLA